MSMGPPDEIDDTEIGPDDAAEPTRPSERGDWRKPGTRDTDDDEVDVGTKRSPLS